MRRVAIYAALLALEGVRKPLRSPDRAIRCCDPRARSKNPRRRLRLRLRIFSLCSRPSLRVSRAWLGPKLSYTLLGTVFGAALSLALPADAQDVSRSETVYRKLEVLAEVIGHIEAQYVESPPIHDLIYGAARGAVASLDDHSAFFTPEEYRDLLDHTEGEFAGIGIEVGWGDGYPEILQIVDGAPAQKAGLREGDQIVAVDGKSVEDLNIEMLQHRLRGPVGSRLELSIRRGAGAPWTYTVVRAWVRVVPLVHKTLANDVQYIRIKTFSRRVAQDFEKILQKAPPRRGLVLDLRDNPGGLFDEAVALCDLFLKEGPIVLAVGRNGRVLDKQVAHPRGTQPAYPLAILIDKRSASAAEVVAAALHDRGRARLFGTRSYGKASVQTVVDLSDGSGLKLTVARYLTPSGRSLDSSGIVPDVEVKEGGDAVTQAAVAWLQQQ